MVANIAEYAHSTSRRTAFEHVFSVILLLAYTNFAIAAYRIFFLRFLLSLGFFLRFLFGEFFCLHRLFWLRLFLLFFLFFLAFLLLRLVSLYLGGWFSSILFFVLILRLHFRFFHIFLFLFWLLLRFLCLLFGKVWFCGFWLSCFW